MEKTLEESHVSVSEEFKRVTELIMELDNSLKRLQTAVDVRKRDISQVLHSGLTGTANTELVNDFLSEPYAILPKKDDEWYVVVPKFIDLQVGWLEKQTKGYNIFLVNRLVDWLTGIPPAIREELEFKQAPSLRVEGDHLVVSPDLQEQIFKRYSKFLRAREGSDKIRIRKKSHFSLVASLIKDGIFPFTPRQVDKADIIERTANIQLRDYQADALDKFLQYGNVGVYWMPSAGKTIFGLYIMNMIKGRKLVVVPSLTLVEQWRERISKYTKIPKDEYEIITYSSARKARQNEYILTIFDECHHLPANMFSKLALIRTKYRLGLSATPYREDGRHELIFALTGFPIGLDWKHLLDLRIVKKPKVKLILTKNLAGKIAVMDTLAKDLQVQRTIVFCDRLSLGKQLSKRYGVQFVYGQTRNRLPTIRGSHLVIVSRVGDEGVSLHELNRVIEFDFLFGSRRQELQRLGRLFHSAFTGEHIILMTEDEYSHYNKRLYSIYEKGFNIAVEKQA